MPTNDRTDNGETAVGASEKKQTPDNPHKNHRQRLRQLFIDNGLSSFPPHNILELLLFYAIPQKDTNELAHRLIDRFGSLSEVFNAPVDKLAEVDGISTNTAVLLSMMPQLFRAYTSDLICGGRLEGRENIESFIFNALRTETVEKVMLVCIDNRWRVIKAEIVCDGSVSFSTVDRRRVIELCLRHNATAAIIAHNHPRGKAVPSAADIQMTDELCTALSYIDVRLIDHIIVAPDRYLSLSSDDRFSAALH